MRHKDPELMKKIRTYIGEFYIEHDRTPSTTEIAKYFGIARSTSQNYLVAMNERGLLSYQGGRLVVEKMEKLRTDRQHRLILFPFGDDRAGYLPSAGKGERPAPLHHRA